MYSWLDDALRQDACIVTANRRLARVLREAHAERQVEAGLTAWATPSILSWQDWLDALFDAASRPGELPVRINAHQSQVLWDRCLRRELGDAATGVNNLVRLAREAWQRLADWQLGIRDVARSVQNRDQRVFAAAAGCYLAILEREGWVDDAGLATLVPDLISAGRIPVSGGHLFIGFDRERPVLARMVDLLRAAGCETDSVGNSSSKVDVDLRKFDTPDAELRVAGAWARQQLDEDPGRVIAIVATNLERNAAEMARLVREGLAPGYQFGPSSFEHLLNVSYGRRLIDYPAVSIALLVAGWIARDLSAGEVSHLLRSPLIGTGPVAGRGRLELRLRRLPDRRWSPSMITSALRNKESTVDATDWLARAAIVTRKRRELPRRASPSEWAVVIDEMLQDWQWPGIGTLDSEDFQVVNRWRELLNDFARLDLVSPDMTVETALRRLEILASETVFQPEVDGGRVQLLGPLEASGTEFDAAWITGATAANWPPPGNPSPLLARRLQAENRMPDANPDDTVEWARAVLSGLVSSAPSVICSYAALDDDAEQSPTALLRSSPTSTKLPTDAGWFGSKLIARRRTVEASDRVPAILEAESLSGGAGTIQRQLTDPVAAFVVGRLGVRPLQPQATGLPPSLRGSIIHDALQSLYVGLPSRQTVAAWAGTALDNRIAKALDFAFTRHERHADSVLARLFAIERERVATLLRGFVTVDAGREDFAVDAVEREIEFADQGVRLDLRVDRIDRLPDGNLVILDYKTGVERKLVISGEPKEIQLVAYACAINEPVAALALVNIDSRAINFNGAGVGFSDPDKWTDTLEGWKQLVHEACGSLSKGDVRVNMAQTSQDARPLGLLTRFTEMRRDG